jgi:sialate O-acetylesterase
MRGERIKGFKIAGAERAWHPAEARIEGGEIVVLSTAVPKPLEVRYGWADNPECNLYNRAGLPLTPFRTDAWD